MQDHMSPKPTHRIEVLASLPDDRLATRTDVLVQLEGVMYRREDDHLVARCPERPDYYSGNLVVALAPVEPDAIPRWLAIWQQAFGSQPEIGHAWVQWETPGDCAPAYQDDLARAAAERGLEVESNVVMAYALPQAPRPAPGLDIRPLDLAREWDATVDLALVAEPGSAAFSAFTAWQRGCFRRMLEAGHGQWWGAWRDGRLAGSAGLFTRNGWARFQEVVTHPELRRRGVCSNLCHAMVEDLRARDPAARVVIVAEPGSDAERVYLRLGFRPIGRQWTLMGARP